MVAVIHPKQDTKLDVTGFKSKRIKNKDFSHPPERFKNVEEKEIYYAQLNYLKKGPDTDKLIKLVTENVVKCGIRVYRIMRDIVKNIPPITKEQLKKASNILGYHNDQLLELFLINPDQKTAQRIEFGQLIASKMDDITSITKKEIKKAARELGFQADQLLKILVNDPNREIELDQEDNYDKRDGKKTIKMHKGTDFPLNILIFYLREHLKKTTGKYDYSLIDGFLGEQEILGGQNESSILRRSQRYSPQKYREVYNFLQEVYEAALDSNMIFNQEMRRSAVGGPESERDMGFPPWEDYLPY
ncbi:MAG: hypothetical protein IMF11_13475 [Proteobacteria bacterium]|nr:hypothetical protein [Pseudomonadota bacterium]